MKLTDIQNLTVKNKAYFIVGIAICLLPFAFLKYPIYSGDTDFWYHLSDGRYISSTGTVPSNSYYSFLDRQWVDYSWLFQYLIYKIYSISGFEGLIFLRSMVFSISLFLLFFYLSDKLFPLIFLSLYFMAFMARETYLIRPYIFSYLFIIMSIIICKSHITRNALRITGLVLIGLVWANIHGVEYVIFLLIVFAYTANYYGHLSLKMPFQKRDIYPILGLLLCVIVILINPNTYHLLKSPFISIKEVSIYINELRVPRIQDFLIFSWGDLIRGTPLNLIFITALVLFLTNLRRIKIGYLILFIAGVYLNLKGIRFGYEASLLFLPILKAYMPEFEFKMLRPPLKVVSIVVLLVFVSLPFYRVKEVIDNKSRYPISPDGLPEGVVRFLSSVGAGGRILNNHNTGGYLQWMLYPEYKIFIDMKVPFLFTKEDFILSGDMFRDNNVFEKVIKDHDPSFLSVSHAYKESFKKIIKSYPYYIPVFYDAVEVLYVNEKHFPLIAERYKLKEIDPFNTNLNVDRMDAERRARVLDEVLRMLSIYPGCGINNYLAGRIYLSSGDYDRAIYHAERIISNYPDKYVGFHLKAEALKMGGRLDEATGVYRKALEREMPVNTHVKILEELMETYITDEKYEEAYRAYRRYINSQDDLLSSKGLVYAGTSASMLNKNKEARWLLYRAYLKTPVEDTEHIQLIEDCLKRLKQ
ncbi:MAG: tetratricopeptide repeat protein [Nitrospirae bacterium]|nr:tetratricopeptide repeat protein [Nitrospirota bacterium]